MPSGAKKILDELPLDMINDLCVEHESLVLRLKRRNSKGQLQSLGSVNVETAKLINLDDWLQNYSGGGKYEIQALDPKNPMNEVLRFKADLEGRARSANYLENPADNLPENPYGGQMQQNGSGFQQPQSAWESGQHPQRQAFYGRGGRPAPGATVASDQIVLRQLAEYKAETAKLLAKQEAAIDRLNDELKRKDTELQREREHARDEKHTAEMAMLREQIRAGNDRPQVQETKGSAEMIAALAPFAPVLAAMVTSRESSASKSMEVQQKGLASLMSATLSQANKPDSTSEMLKTLLPLALPFIKDMMNAKSPDAQAKLFNNMVENNLSQVAMMAQLIESFAGSGDNEPWWLPMIKETLNGVVGMTEAYMQGQGLPGQAPVQMPPGVPAPQQMPAGQTPIPAGASYSTEGEEFPEAEVVAGPNVEAAKARADAAMQQPITAGNGLEDTLTMPEKMILSQLPPEYQTAEWRAIAIALHREAELEGVSMMTANHIGHLINFNLLPPALQDVETDPARALDRLLAPMPVMKRNPEYAIAVLKAVVEMLIEDGFVTQPAPLAEPTEAPTPEVAEEAPAAPAAAS